jgi:hypothetical protein
MSRSTAALPPSGEAAGLRPPFLRLRPNSYPAEDNFVVSTKGKFCYTIGGGFFEPAFTGFGMPAF